MWFECKRWRLAYLQSQPAVCLCKRGSNPWHDQPTWRRWLVRPTTSERLVGRRTIILMAPHRDLRTPPSDCSPHGVHCRLVWQVSSARHGTAQSTARRGTKLGYHHPALGHRKKLSAQGRPLETPTYQGGGARSPRLGLHVRETGHVDRTWYSLNDYSGD